MSSLRENYYNEFHENLLKPRGIPQVTIDIFSDTNQLRWGPFFGQIDPSSWIVLEKFILTQLPLSGTKQEPSDYVDHQEGFIYRIRELSDDEERPKATTGIPNEGPVRPYYPSLDCINTEYLIGSTGSLRFSSAKTDPTHPMFAPREHENIEYAAAQKPKHFHLPRVFHHVEAGGKYAILTERVGTSIFKQPIPAKYLGRLQGQVAAAVAEMSQWEAPSVQGVNGKDVKHRAFIDVDETVIRKGQCAADRIHAYLADKGFNMSHCGFLNAFIGMDHIGLDKDFNLAGFNNWSECAFVPRGYIIPYVLREFGHLSVPAGNRELPENHSGLLAQGTLDMAIEMMDRGLPNDKGCYQKVLWDYITYREWLRHTPLAKRGEGYCMFPDTDPFYRRDIFPDLD